MKKFYTAICSLCAFLPTVFSQVNPAYTFPVTGSNVIVYKQGTSCTASAYSFYLISDTGIPAASPFYTLASTTREVNGIGINPVDSYLYGIEYDRDAGCAFSNFHLVRYDTHGNSDDLGSLPPIPGGAASGALGCVTSNGNFIYSAKDVSGNSYITVIANISMLPANPGTTLPIYRSKQIVNNAGAYIYADWAVRSSDNKMYTYGITNVGGVSTGSLLVLDTQTGILTTVGTVNSTDFLDVARDNFGGVYFGTDGFLYGVNVNTRKLYKFNPATGTTQYVSTFSGSGQIRADMGSYTSGLILLPVAFTKTAIDLSSHRLEWNIEGDGVQQFVVEQNSGNGFVAFAVATSLFNQKSFSVTIPPGVVASYRIKAIGYEGKNLFSPVVMATANGNSVFQVINNPVQDGMLRLLAEKSWSGVFVIYNNSGQVVKRGTMVCTKGTAFSLDVHELHTGLYTLQRSDGVSLRFVVK